MIVREYYGERSDGVKLYRNYSDQGFKIKPDGIEAVYDEAIESEDTPYIYIETDEKIVEEEITEIELKAQAYDILVGEVK